jgi:hypothetical protein
MTALLALLLAAEPPDAFRAWQYAAKTVTLRGCSDCKGEPDDVCEVRAGAQVRPLEEYAAGRWPAPDRLKLLRARADPDCAVPAKALFGARGALELAAIRIAPAPPSAALVEQAGQAVAGWPRSPAHRKPQPPAALKPLRNALRFALACWASEQGWPVRTAPGPGNACELWLLPVQPDGAPALGGASFLLASGVEAGTPLQEWVVLGEAQPGAEARPVPPPAPPAPAACGDDARARTATLERFEQWEQQIRGARRSLDRAAWTLDAAVWSGHCQELEVLHAALEQQLGCAVAEQGRCAP